MQLINFIFLHVTGYLRIILVILLKLYEDPVWVNFQAINFSHFCIRLVFRQFIFILFYIFPMLVVVHEDLKLSNDLFQYTTYS